MDKIMTFKHAGIFVVVILLTIIGATASVSANDNMCNSKAELNFCIEDFETNKDTVKKGSVVEGEVSITNVGNNSGNVVIIIGLRDSKGGYTYHRVGVLHNLEAGETQPYEFQLSATEDSTIGEHKMNVRLMDMPEKHLYDSTGYTSSIYLEENPITIGWILDQLNAVTAILVGLFSILAYAIGGRDIR